MEYKFNEAQQKVINLSDGNVAVNATAGSGKTSVIIARIKNLIENHNANLDHILTLTFSNEACLTLKQRGIAAGLDADKFEVRTFHSLALKIYKEFNHIESKTFKLLDSQKKQKDDYLCLASPVRSNFGIDELSDFISMSKRLLLSPTAPEEAFEKISPYYKEMRKSYFSYEQLKISDGNIMEFDDFIMAALAIFEKNPEVRESYQNYYSHILVDEFQDIDYGQYCFINSLSNGHNLMVVGDIFQAIYGFRGGNSSYLLNFSKDHSDTTVISMNTNYRCSNRIIASANKLCEALPESSNEHYVPSVTISTSKKIPRYKECKNEWTEAEYVAKQILKKEMSFKDVCILARTNAQLQVVQNALSAYSIPFCFKGGKSLLEIPEVKTMIAYIEFAHNPHNNQAFLQIYDRPKRWLGEKFLLEIQKLARKYDLSYYEAMLKTQNRYWRFARGVKQIKDYVDYAQKLKSRNMGTLIGHIRKKINFDQYILSVKHVGNNRRDEALESINSFQELCRPIKTYDELTRVLNKIKSDSKEDASVAVNLMTIHQAKGLEFPIVFLIGCSDELLPHIRNEDKQEECKLFYVAITRAINELYLSRPLKYQNRILQESKFIEILEDTIKKIK